MCGISGSLSLNNQGFKVEPVLAAIAQSVKDNINGFLLPEPDPVNLAKALEQLLTNESLRMNMGVSSFALYEREFTADGIVKRLTAVFDEVLHL